jgi:hypothetical protein
MRTQTLQSGEVFRPMAASVLQLLMKLDWLDESRVIVRYDVVSCFGTPEAF